MKYLRSFRFICLIFVAMAGLATILATGGGGGGSSSTSTDGGGSVALMIADGPADGYESITIYIKEVSLIPVDEDGRIVEIFRSEDPEGYPVNLLDYREEDFLLTVKHGVPSGWYEKIRLRVGEIESVGGECDLQMIKLPSGKIDLNPRENFYVNWGETLGIRLDFDANKSINLHSAGKSGKCIFRPVVFVDIDNLGVLDQCPKIVRGTIDELIVEDLETTAFWLDLPGDGEPLEVILGEDARIFDPYGLPGSPEDLEVGQTVWVRGTLDEGRLIASMVVIGDILVLEGMATSLVNTMGLFYFIPDVGEEITTNGAELGVQLYEESLVLIGCDDEVPWEAIQSNMRARVAGKYSSSDGLFRAAVVFLGSQEVSGMITDTLQDVDGLQITVQPDEGEEITVFVSNSTPVYLEEDGLVSNALLCAEKQVRILIDPSELDPTAQVVFIQPDEVIGQVSEKSDSTLVINGYTVQVQPSATILDLRGGDQEEVVFEDIEQGNQVVVYGTLDCQGGAFLGFTVLIVDVEP
ncbi:MAG: DUF4382 domain-containing protein [Deltaproteobacteria bacterium]|jgi:hypothetical protein